MQSQQDGRVGGYRLLRSLGVGGMGEVWLAEHPRLPRQIALKIMRPGSDVAEARIRFLREAETVARLDHPSIVDVIDRGEDGDRLWIAMRFVEGEDLHVRLRRTGPLTVQESLPIVRAMAEAIDHAHSQGVVHRDIKPANILLPASGQPAAVVTDFGIARAVEEVSSATAQGAVVGSMSYVSPEQFDGDRADKRSDIYAFACTIYELLSGEKAFDARTTSALIAAHFAQQRPTLRERNRQVPAEVDKVVRRGLAVDPQRRWASAGELVDALERVANAPVVAEVPTRVQQTTASPTPRGRGAGVLVGAATLLVAAGVTAWMLLPDGGPRAGSSTTVSSSPLDVAGSPGSTNPAPSTDSTTVSGSQNSSTTEATSSGRSSATAPPTGTPSTVTESNSSSTAPSTGTGGDLGLATSISTPGCTGSGVVVLHSVASNSVDSQRSQVSSALAKFPGASYMRPDCPSIRSVKGGQQIYTVYATTGVGAGDETGLCAAVRPYANSTAGSPYGKFLDDSHPIGHFYRWDSQLQHCYYYADTGGTRREVM